MNNNEKLAKALLDYISCLERLEQYEKELKELNRKIEEQRIELSNKNLLIQEVAGVGSNIRERCVIINDHICFLKYTGENNNKVITKILVPEELKNYENTI